MQELFLNVGAQIHFGDGAGGTLHKVVVDPRTNRISDLVILRGFFQKHDYVLPVSTVEKATPDEIYIALNISDLANYPEYREVEFQEPLNDQESELVSPSEASLLWYPAVGILEGERKYIPVVRRTIPIGIPTKEKVIGRSSVVRNMDGIVGKVDHLWLDRETWAITHLIVHSGLIRHYTVIPFSWVTSITPEEIFIRGTNAQLKAISATEVRLELSSASSGENGREEIHLDDRLAVTEEVTAALAADPRTASSVIEVIYDQGVITLTGEVKDNLTHSAAEKIAHRHKSVLSVVNALEVRPEAVFNAMEIVSLLGKSDLE